MLTLKQSNEVTRGNKLFIFLKAAILIFTSFKPFKKVYDNFIVNYGNMTTEAKKKTPHASGNTDVKTELKSLIASTLALILSTTLEYAKGINDLMMISKVSFSESQILYMKDGDILNFISQLKKDVFTDALFLDTLFMESEIILDMINALMLQATDFTKMIGSTKVIDSASTIANDNMDICTTKIHENIVSMDNLIGNFLTDHPDFVSGYYINSALESVGTRHEGFEGVVDKNGIIEKGSMVRIVGTDKSTVTDSDGHFILIRIKPGTYTVIACNAAGDSNTMTIVVRYKHIEVVNFHLE